MPLKQGKFVNKQAVTMPGEAGEIHQAAFTHIFDAALLATDFVEVGVLPAACKITALTVISENIAAVSTLDFGFVSGQYGDPDPARTLGTEFFAATARNAAAALTVLQCHNIAESNQHRGLGFRASLNEALGAGKRVLIVVEYKAVNR